MPHKQAWLIKDHVVSVTFTGTLSAKDIGDAFRTSGDYAIEASEGPVHFLHDWRVVDSFPTSLSKVMKEARGSTRAPAHKVGWVVAYGKNNRLFRWMGDVFFQIFGLQFRLFKTRDEAIAFLCQRDERLNEDALLNATIPDVA